MCAEVWVCSDPVTCNKASKVNDCVLSSLGLSARAPQQHKYQLPHWAHHCTLHTEKMQPTLLSPKTFTNTAQLLIDHWHLVKQSSHLTQDDGNWQKNGSCQIHKWLAECKEKATWVWKLNAASGNPSFTWSLAPFVLVFPAASEELLSSQSLLHCSCGRKTTCCCCDAVSVNDDCFTVSGCMTVWLRLCLSCGPICSTQTCLLRLDDDIGWRQCFKTFCQTKKGDIFKGLGWEKQKHFCCLCLWVHDSAHSEQR